MALRTICEHCGGHDTFRLPGMTCPICGQGVLRLPDRAGSEREPRRDPGQPPRPEPRWPPTE